MAHRSATKRAIGRFGLPRSSINGWFRKIWSLLCRKIQDAPCGGVPQRSCNCFHGIQHVPRLPVSVGMPMDAAGRHVGSAVVGRQKGRPLASAHLVVQGVKQALAIPCPNASTCPWFLGHAAPRGARRNPWPEAQCQEVGHVVLSEVGPSMAANAKSTMRVFPPGVPFRRSYPPFASRRALRSYGKVGFELP